MWIYDLLFIWCLLIYSLNFKSKKIKVLVMIAPLCFLAMFRSANIGNDTQYYHDLYNSIGNLELNVAMQYYSKRFENGFIYLNKFLFYLSSNPQTIIIFSSLLFYSSLFVLLSNYSKNIFFSLFLFITLRYYFFFFSNIRQEIAMSLTIFSYIGLKKNKLLIPLALVIVASFFHLSSLCVLVLFPFKILKLKSKAIIIIIILGLAVFVFWNKLFNAVFNYLPSEYKSYSGTTYMEDANNLANWLNFFVVLAIGVTVFYFSKKTNNKIDYFDLYVIALSCLISLLSIRFSMMSRFQYYFSILMIVFLPNSLRKLKSDKRKGIEIISSCLFYAYHITILIARPEWQHVYPYELCF